MVQWYVEIQKGEMPSLAIDASENARRRGIEEKMLNTGVEKFRHEEYFFKQLQNKKILKRNFDFFSAVKDENRNWLCLWMKSIFISTQGLTIA